MRQSAKRLPDIYDALTLGLIGVLFALALIYWSRFPIFRDIYYHMGAATAFGKAGGVALHDFWEFAPVGRPHLYPPLLHILMYLGSLTGLSMGTIGKIVSFSAFYLILLSTWYGMRRLFSRRVAFYSTVVLASCFMFFWQTAVTSAASLVLIITPLLFVALEEDHEITAGIMLALALYSHLVLGHLIALGMFIYGLHRREMLRRLLPVLAGAYVLWSPWGVHILSNYGSLELSSPMGAPEGMSVHLLVWAAALAGLVCCYFKKGRYYIPPALLMGMVPILFFYPHRFWDGHVFFPLAMLGGVALSGLHGFLSRQVKKISRGGGLSRAAAAAGMAFPVMLLLLVDPVFATLGGKGRPFPAPGLQPRDAIERAFMVPRKVAPQGSGAFPRANRVPDPSSGEEDPGPLAGPEIQATFPPATGFAPAGRQGSGGFPPYKPDARGQPFPPERGAGPWPGSAGSPGAGPPDARVPPGPGGVLRPTEAVPGRVMLRTHQTTLVSLLKGEGGRGEGQSLDNMPILDGDSVALCRSVARNGKPETIVFATDPSVGNLITGLTGLPSTTGMFREVRSEASVGTPDKAGLVVVQSGGRAGGLTVGDGKPGPPRQPDTSEMRLIGIYGPYSLYENEEAETFRLERGAVVPWEVVLLALLLAVAIAALDCLRPLHPLRSLSARRAQPKRTEGWR